VPLVPADVLIRDVIPDEARRQWYLARTHAEPLKTLTQPIRLSNPAAMAIPRTFIGCTSEGVNESMKERVCSTPGWRYQELMASHFALITHPNEVADLLLEAVLMSYPSPRSSTDPRGRLISISMVTQAPTTAVSLARASAPQLLNR
jgi:hypothetical protein